MKMVLQKWNIKIKITNSLIGNFNFDIPFFKQGKLVSSKAN